MKIKKKHDIHERSFVEEITKNWQLYLMVLIPLIYILVFKYGPMYGAQIAFRDYKVSEGIWGSEWVGLKHFKKLIESAQFWNVVKNTVLLSIYSLAVSIPFPIMLAIGINYTDNRFFKKSVQMISYLPHFISIVIIVSMVNMVFNVRTGVVTNIVAMITGERPDVLSAEGSFRHLYVWSGLWQSIGWNSIIYVSALAGVDPELHEAAIIDRANKWQRIWHIDIPSILPTIAILIIMNMGQILTVGFDKTYLMQSSVNLDVSEVLSTYEYKNGIGSRLPQFSYPSAIGLLSSTVTFIMVMASNKISNKLSGYGLW